MAIGRATANGLSKNQGCLEFAAVSGSLLAQRRVDSVRGRIIRRPWSGPPPARRRRKFTCSRICVVFTEASRTALRADRKKAFAIAWACEKFHDYLFGLLQFHVYTDHKPLVPLLSVEKRLDELPPRVQRFRLRLTRDRFSISHVPGPQMFTPDTLSRAPLPNTDPAADELTEAAAAYALGVIADLPATEDKPAEIWELQKKDEVCSLLAKFCANGWPDVNALNGELKLYYKVAGEISVTEDLLRRNRLIIPHSRRQEMVERLHEEHLGIVKCRARANCSVEWPNVSVQIQEKIERCDICNKDKTNRPEPMLQSESPYKANFVTTQEVVSTL